jgi:hypothetical protein
MHCWRGGRHRQLIAAQKSALTKAAERDAGKLAASGNAGKKLNEIGQILAPLASKPQSAFNVPEAEEPFGHLSKMRLPARHAARRQDCPRWPMTRICDALGGSRCAFDGLRRTGVDLRNERLLQMLEHQDGQEALLLRHGADGPGGSAT